MMVIRKGISDAIFIHDNETCAIREAPFFIGSAGVYAPGFLMDVLVNLDDFYEFCCLYRIDKLNSVRAPVRLTQRVSNFDYDIAGNEEVFLAAKQFISYCLCF